MDFEKSTKWCELIEEWTYKTHTFKVKLKHIHTRNKWHLTVVYKGKHILILSDVDSSEHALELAQEHIIKYVTAIKAKEEKND